MNNKSFSIFTSLVVCLVVGNPSCSGEEQPARIFECVYTAVPVIVDGNLSEDAWRNASEIARFTRPGPGGVLPNSVTKVRTCWDKDYFYFAAEMEDRDIVARLTQHDDLLWTEDVFEVFMRPSKQHNGYYEFQVNPLETTLDIYWPQMPMGKDARNQMFRDQLKSNEFDFDVRVKQLQEQNYWIVEGRIGWKQMHMTGGRPAVEEAWDVAFCRYDYGLDRKPETSSSASLSRIDFHAVEEYDRLVFKTPVRVSAKTHVDQSRVVGSPDPPLRYTVKKLIPRLPLSQAIFMTANPQTGELIFINQGESGGKSQLLLQHGATNELVTMVELDELAYSLCFHPKFADNGYIYVGTNQTTGVDSKSRVWRYQFNGARCDPDDRKLIIEWPSNGHNGAAVSFGLDGMLYVTSGDGTSDSDTNLAGQRLDHLLGKVLRLDVDHPDDGRGYGIPTDNPFMDREGVRKETFAYGLRNPWRMTTDPNTGNIWIGNNGQDQWEQIYLLERGANYGWSVYEGGHAFYLTRMLGPDPLTKPIFDHPHSEARSLTGGIVYHGSRYPDLNGSYLYGDHSTGKIWAAKHNGKRLLRHEEIADTQLAIVAFAVGPEGNILILDYKSDTEIFELIPNTRKVQVRDFPRKLSETGLFVDVRNHAMQEGVIPYDVNSPLWSDGVLKNRFIALTSDSSKITATHQGAWEF
ncbi:MAG: PQQ-dependent sugar dehydrogenase, partial [Planctomycetota bacterium]|nr:PQQ-dependent sugar dehydrogenase [Planctomycetota bacterium]